MLIVIFLIAAFNLASSAPLLPSTTGFDPATRLTILGREVPDCINVARYRTIQDIVWSCLATIFACTWVAVHPNVPSSYNSGWVRFKRRLLIMVYAILAPEFIIMWALRQRIGAARHADGYNKKFYPGVTPPTHSIWWYIKGWFRSHEDEAPDGLWTVTHGFLLEMHGLTWDWGKPVQSVESRLFIDGIPEPVDIPEEEIHDKSKGDFLTKLLVVLQTTWFILQCTARWIQHLPVTELEVITLAFALLNVGTYILWWNKPQNMGVAIPMTRFVRLKTTQEESEATGGDVIEGISPAEEKEENAGEARVLSGSEPALETESEASRPHGRYTRPGTSQRGTTGNVVQEEVPAADGEKEGVDEAAIASGSGPSSDIPHVRKSSVLGKAVGVMGRCARSARALIRVMATTLNPRHFRTPDFQDITEFLMGPIKPLMAMLYKVKYAPHTFYSSVKGTESWRTNLPICIISILFGSLHLIPLWLSTFPSAPEKLLWQLSAIWITIEPFLLLSTWALQVSHIAKRHRILGILADRLLILNIVGGGLLYVIARLVLVFLAFTALRDLPPDAYRNIAWTTFLPHF